MRVVRSIILDAIIFLTERFPSLRPGIIAYIKENHYRELDFILPLAYELRCPFYLPQSFGNFSEFFFGNDYKAVFSKIPLPDRWVDLGCFCGHFSLMVVYLRKEAGLDDNYKALLVDADRRVRPSVEKLISTNKLSDNFNFRHAAIGSRRREEVFIESGYLTSAKADCSLYEGVRTAVPVISDDEIISALPGPYGLVKVDIEGAEWDFLNYYPKVMANARYLLLDWHSWHKGGKAEGQVREEIERRGFKFVYEVRPAVSYTVNGKNVCGGAHLYENMG